MKTAADFQSYLMKMELPYEEPHEGMWLVNGGAGENIVVTLAPPLVAFRLKVMELPKGKREELYRTLLELNAHEMMHGAYGIEGENIVISDALQMENCDFNEFAATIEDIGMAVSSHHAQLAKFREAV